jgi:hypothetical protein
MSHILNNFVLELEKSTLYAWITPADLRRNQLDYILVKHRFKNSMNEAQTMLGIDIDPVNNSLATKIYTKF